MNQCDGCQARMKVVDGIHYTKTGIMHMMCEKDLYTKPGDTNVSDISAPSRSIRPNQS